MWGLKIRRRRHWLVDELHARAQQAEVERDTARLAAATAEAAAILTAGRNTILTEQIENLTAVDSSHGADIEALRDRVDRLTRACARYRADSARAVRDAARLQARLDDYLGLNSPAVLEKARSARPAQPKGASR
ncbi:hypothetical protein [Streptomyces sp. NPDC017941]|uniref:hypothetical protein n=1 Tax=Streptomyces sp. NPDC017941 TaxID=3365018 RepID=UPI00379F7F26